MSNKPNTRKNLWTTIVTKVETTTATVGITTPLESHRPNESPNSIQKKKNEMIEKRFRRLRLKNYKGR